MRLVESQLQPFTRGDTPREAVEGIELEVGQHIRIWRNELALSQSNPAKALGFTFQQVQIEPADQFFPAIIRFLGHGPWPTLLTIAAQLRAERRRRGMPVEASAKLMGIARGALANWESGLSEPNASNRKRMEAFLRR